VESLHDMHERLTPNQAVKSCKEGEKFHMFVLEEPSSPGPWILPADPSKLRDADRDG
jgi:L-alanine-DL-glutamate epimerase-like enolase superfamily enzyme